jgi:hypothetical protein
MHRLGINQVVVVEHQQSLACIGPAGQFVNPGT